MSVKTIVTSAITIEGGDPIISFAREIITFANMYKDVAIVHSEGYMPVDFKVEITLRGTAK